MSSLFSWFVIMCAIMFFFFALPTWVNQAEQNRQQEIQNAPVNGPKLKMQETKFGGIKRARLEGHESDNVELVEYPNGLVCVKYEKSNAHGKGAGIDCDWGNYRKRIENEYE